MKRVLYTFALLSLWACQKENHQDNPPTEEPAPAPVVCKVNTIQEHPAVEGNNILRTFTYDDKNRVIKMELQPAGGGVMSKTINYNAEGRIDNISTSAGGTENFVYTNGVLTAWEATDAENKPFKKSLFVYNGSKLVREERYLHNAATNAYVLNDSMSYSWDANGNIAAITTYGTDGAVKASDTYAYHADKLNKQQTVTPQMNLMFMNWSNDITAFINSKYLLRQVTSKGRNLVYQTNDAGLVISIRGDKKENYFDFSYGCSQ